MLSTETDQKNEPEILARDVIRVAILFISQKC